MHSKYFKKMIAPIIITVVLIAYLVVFASVFISKLIADAEVDAVVIIFLGIVPLILAGISVYVLIERIKEIKKGENDDDISKY